MSSSPTYHSGRAIILRGDARKLPLPDSSVDLIMTSPPFWQLRSYSDGGQHYEGQIGDEPTWQEYIANLLDCTREWIRVLKPAGSLFVELGDKYSDRGRGPQAVRLRQTRGPMEKCLLDLPSRYSIACVDQFGLIKRANIVWNHVNGLPESTNDRVKVAHSMVFHFTVRPRYYAAVDEIREPHTYPGDTNRTHRNGRPPRMDLHDDGWRGEQNRLAGPERDRILNPLGKLPGSVWSIPSAPLSVPAHLGVDHFAAYPPELCRRIILGWSPPGVCTACGEGRVNGRYIASGFNGGQKNWELRMAQPDRIAGYACACPQPDAPTRPALVVDPFGGTGTTALVAAAYGRTGVTVDRSADYCRLAAWRCPDPGERARAMQVPKPPPVTDGQDALFSIREVAP